jgi:primosomal protein N'
VLVEVALPLPLFTTFSYRAEGDLANAIVPGTRVVVPFRNRKEIGICVGFAEPTNATRQYKSILEVPDAERQSMRRCWSCAAGWRRTTSYPSGLCCVARFPAS